jgi:hypothetical protein
MNPECRKCHLHQSQNQRFFGGLDADQKRLVQLVLCAGCEHSPNSDLELQGPGVWQAKMLRRLMEL